MFRIIRTIITIFSATVWLLPVWAQSTTLLGTSISVDVPSGFEVSNQFTGLQNLETGASFLFGQLPSQARPQVSDIFQSLAKADAAFKGKSITLREEVVLDTSQTDFSAFHGTQTVGDVEFVKWVSFFASENVLIVSYQSPPPGDEDTLITTTLESIRIGAPLTISEQIDALPYKFGSTGGMRIVGILAGNVTGLTIGDRDIDPRGDQPSLIVGTSLGAAGPAYNDPIAYSKWLLSQAANLTVERILDEEEMIVVGWPGNRLEALGKSTSTGRNLHVVQWVGYSEFGYFRVIAQSPVELWDNAIQHFETVVAGLERLD